MKRIVLCGVAALSVVGLMLIADRGDVRERDVVVRYDDDRYEDGRRYHRGPIRGTIDGATDIARGTGHAIGHGLKNIFGGGRHHRGYYDSRGDYHE